MIDLYRATGKGREEIDAAVGFGELVQVTLHQCVDCGHQSLDEKDFVMRGEEEPNYGMDDPYPGYGGEPVCLGCVGGTNEPD